MPGPKDRQASTSEAPATACEPGRAAPGAQGLHRPSRALRGLLGRASRVRGVPVADRPGASGVPRAPGVLPLIAATVAVGAAAGFLELAVFSVQVHGLHFVDLTSLRISRHVAWMIPVAEALVTIPLAFALLAPALLLAARRSRTKRPDGRAGLAWDWAGAVLGTLLFLGPLMAIRGLYPGAALVLAAGLGVRLRRLFVRPSPGWGRAAGYAGLIAIVVLPRFAIWHWGQVAQAGDRASALPPIDAPNVLWIVTDTVRADRLSLYGYGRLTTPELVRWAGRGMVFDEARSAAPWTLPSHVSMFTSLWPHEQGARIDRPYRGSHPTIAEHLGSRGYATAGFAANTGMCNACFGVGRGFDTYVEFLCNHEVSLRATLLNSSLGTGALKSLRKLGIRVPTQFPFPGRALAPTIADRGRRWLDEVHRPMAETTGSRRPFFLFLNFMDAHGPYVPLDEADRRFSGDRPMPPRKQAVPTTGSEAVRAAKAAGPEDRPQKQKELDGKTRLLSDLYDDCLRGLDAELGLLLDGLRASGKLDNTWVVITSDHGEYFGEHGLFGHGGRLHNEVTHVPLMLIPPMGRAGRGDDPSAALRGRRIDAPVSLCDLPATLSDLLAPGASHPFRGRSLARFWRGDGPVAPDPILMQMEEQGLEGDDVTAEGIVKTDAVLHEGHVLILSNAKPPELFRIDDRKQQRDLADEPGEQERVRRMQRVADALLDGSARK